VHARYEGSRETKWDGRHFLRQGWGRFCVGWGRRLARQRRGESSAASL